MNITNVFGSSIGKKFIMAITGLALFVFVALHMVGNLQVFLGPETLNRYGAFLQGNMELLWPARIGLLVLVLLHIWAAVKLSAENRAARPQPYARHEIVAASYASRTMLMSGLIIAAFIVYHLLHFTVQVPAVNLVGQTKLMPTGSFVGLEDAKGRHDIFAMMVLGFQRPLVSLFYIIAMGLLFMHLSHGVSAMFQSLGFKSPTYGPLIARFSVIASWLIFLGYISIPIAILLGYGSNYVEALK
jgi:succinate dehydrogenase / fumarate reductase cytochrome b subunit